VMERFLWQSYPQHLQNTLFHSERIAPLRKKTLQERLEHAYEFKGRGDEKVDNGKYREAITQYEYAYGLFKYCEKSGRKITMQDDSKSARELREEQANEGNLKEDAFTTFWLEVDELLCSCCTMIAVCKLNLKHPLPDDALAAANEALEIRPRHSPALYRRSQVHLKMENYSEAVDDARNAYRYAPEEHKFNLWKHREEMVQTRREKTLWWGFWGAVYDTPRAVVTFPWTFANMTHQRQAMMVLYVAMVAGTYVAYTNGAMGAAWRSAVSSRASDASEEEAHEAAAAVEAAAVAAAAAARAVAAAAAR